jgi:hypothetical protein
MLAAHLASAPVGVEPPLRPFEPDAHTLVLYHFDEGAGTVAHDSSGHGYDGGLRGPEWTSGKFGGALWFDGKAGSVFREVPAATRGLRQLTVESWFSQEGTSGRRFLVGQDVGFHFEIAEGMRAGLSIYNQGGSVPNAEGKPHQQLGAALGSVRVERWHHLAATYDGTYIAFFLDGVLKSRAQAAKNFLLGVPSRGLWIGCYVGTDFWYSGKLDEVRISDCVRYDPERKLQPGGMVFEMPRKVTPPKVVRTPRRTGLATLDLTLRKLYGGNAAGWVYLKPPGKRAAIVGQYALSDLGPGAETRLSLDVSDQLAGQGRHLLGLEPTDAEGYFAVTGAKLSAGGKTLAEWSGEARSRRTFMPPVLVPLQVGGAPATTAPQPVLLGPGDIDRQGGQLETDDEDPASSPLLVGDGYAEYWLDVPHEATYRVHLRYAAAAPRPCDIVIDGDDLNAFDMCAVNSTGRATAQDAFWEYQGTATLSPGVHWLRVQDVLPEIVALRLEPAPRAKRVSVPWERYPAPDAEVIGQSGTWSAQPRFGHPTGASATRQEVPRPSWRFSTTFSNANTADLFAGDCVRFVRAGRFDLEPFGRLTLGFEGCGSGHVVALWLIDVKGDEKLLWRTRDRQAGSQQVVVPVSFEGNDVFDPAHVTAICLDLDEGNVHPDQVASCTVTLTDPRFVRRDELAWDAGAAAHAERAFAEVLPGLARKAPALRSPGFRPWTEPVVPERYPLFATAEPKPVTRATLGYDLHFTGARDVSVSALDEFHRDYDFGDICWPHIGILPQRRDFRSDADYQKALQSLEERLVDVRDRGLILWDIWGYVPNDEAGPTPRVAPEHHVALLRVLGDRFLGYDDGEQDGRYIGAYADRDPITDRRTGWEAFARWDQGLCNDSLGYMNATGSLNFSHYYGERGCRTLGLETAQGLPSDTLMFAFLRGASKQYGRLTTQATSIWNRFGYNMYHDRRTDGANGYGLGPHKGCSLSLHGRLFFCSYLGGDSIVGSETSQFTADTLENGAPELSPLGRQHLALREWVRQHPDRGVMYTPIAFMLDFYSGWTVSRHLYRGDKYKVWGKLPYAKGDYLIDNTFRMVWPGYEDSSYLRNERGFICPTPYGDLFDVITNRCSLDILKQYTTIMLLGEVELSPEVVANLSAFVAAGGDLVLDARQAQAFAETVTGVRLGEPRQARLTHDVRTGRTFPEQPYTYARLAAAGAQVLLVNERGDPILTLARSGRGRVVVGAADNWMTGKLEYVNADLVNMEPPYLLLRGVREVLGGYFGSFSPVEVLPGGLTVRTCCFDNDPQRRLIGLLNNDLFADWSGKLRLREGVAASAEELWHGRQLTAGREITLSIPAGDVAIIDVRLR